MVDRLKYGREEKRRRKMARHKPTKPAKPKNGRRKKAGEVEECLECLLKLHGLEGGLLRRLKRSLVRAGDAKVAAVMSEKKASSSKLCAERFEDGGGWASEMIAEELISEYEDTQYEGDSP